MLDAIEADVLHPDVVSAAIREALDELRGLGGQLANLDAAKLQKLIAEWRKMFRNNVATARQILAQLLDGERVVFTPQADGGWDFVAPCTLDRVSIGVGTGTPQKVVAPTGFEPVFQP